MRSCGNGYLLKAREPPDMNRAPAALSFVTGVIVVFAIFAPDQLGWHVFPIWVCGFLATFELLAHIKRRNFSGAGLLVDILAFHLMFAAPLLHMWWEFYMPFVVPPEDWKPWLGYMALLNAVSFLGFMLARRAARSWAMSRVTPLVLEANRLVPVGVGMFAMALALQTYVYAQFGGIAGYVTAFTEEPALFSGWGWIFAVSEIGPVMLGWAIVVRWKQRRTKVSEPYFLAFMTIMVLLIAYFGGLKGSRNHYVWELVWVAGVFAIWIRPPSRALIAGGGVFLMLFMMGYSYFKEYGANIGEVIQNPSIAADSWRYGGRVFEGVILGDFSRSDVQAYELHKLSLSGSDYEPALGMTYVAAFGQIVPKFLIGERPAAKAYYGTWLLFGKGAADSGFVASNIYGLAGEALLNFGVVGVPLLFLLFGAVVGRAERYFAALNADDARWLFFPFIVILLGWTFVSDVDNVLVFVMKYGTIPFLVLTLTSRRSKQPCLPAQDQGAWRPAT